MALNIVCIKYYQDFLHLPISHFNQIEVIPHYTWWNNVWALTSWNAWSTFSGGSLALVSMYGIPSLWANSLPASSETVRKCTKSTLFATNNIGYTSLLTEKFIIKNKTYEPHQIINSSNWDTLECRYRWVKYMCPVSTVCEFIVTSNDI